MARICHKNLISGFHQAGSTGQESIHAGGQKSKTVTPISCKQ